MKKTYIKPVASLTQMHMEQVLLTLTGDTFRTNTTDYKGTGEEYIYTDNSQTGTVTQDAKHGSIDWDF